MNSFIRYWTLGQRSRVLCTCVVDLLGDVDPLPVGQTSVHWRPCGRSQRRVERIDVEAQVDRPLFPERKKENRVSSD